MMYGVLLAGIKGYRPDWWARLGSNLAWVGVGLLGFWFAAYFSVDIQQTDWLKVLTFCIVPAGCAAFLPVLDRWTRAGSPFWDRWITNLSLWSYSMYLLHFLLLVIALHEFSRWTEPSLAWAWVVFLGWACATGAIGGQVWRRFELPTTNLRERFFKG
jgi:peptidoglycan/LPS O-acetylase OafA/YrhL